MIIVMSLFFEQLHFQNVFRSQENEKPAFSSFSGSKSVLENLRFQDGLVWTVDLIGERNLRFQISKQTTKNLHREFCSCTAGFSDCVYGLHCSTVR